MTKFTVKIATKIVMGTFIALKEGNARAPVLYNDIYRLFSAVGFDRDLKIDSRVEKTDEENEWIKRLKVLTVEIKKSWSTRQKKELQDLVKDLASFVDLLANGVFRVGENEEEIVSYLTARIMKGDFIVYSRHPEAIDDFMTSGTMELSESNITANNPWKHNYIFISNADPSTMFHPDDIEASGIDPSSIYGLEIVKELDGSFGNVVKMVTKDKESCAKVTATDVAGYILEKDLSGGGEAADNEKNIMFYGKCNKQECKKEWRKCDSLLVKGLKHECKEKEFHGGTSIKKQYDELDHYEEQHTIDGWFICNHGYASITRHLAFNLLKPLLEKHKNRSLEEITISFNEMRKDSHSNLVVFCFITQDKKIITSEGTESAIKDGPCWKKYSRLLEMEIPRAKKNTIIVIFNQLKEIQSKEVLEPGDFLFKKCACCGMIVLNRGEYHRVKSNEPFTFILYCNECFEKSSITGYDTKICRDCGENVFRFDFDYDDDYTSSGCFINETEPGSGVFFKKCWSCKRDDELKRIAKMYDIRNADLLLPVMKENYWLIPRLKHVYYKMNDRFPKPSLLLLDFVTDELKPVIEVEMNGKEEEIARNLIRDAWTEDITIDFELFDAGYESITDSEKIRETVFDKGYHREST
jgi:hypothetical protein